MFTMFSGSHLPGFWWLFWPLVAAPGAYPRWGTINEYRAGVARGVERWRWIVADQEPQFDKNEKKLDLARAVARGQSIVVWARKNDVPVRTAYNWASEPEVRKSSEMWRRAALNQAIGRMARSATAAAGGIERLARGADSESVRLSAWRAILADQMSVAKFSTLEQRMTELEEQQEKRQQQFGPQFGGK